MSRTRAVIDQDIADEVSAFLRAHPGFLADNPDLYHVLTPPVRIHNDAIADHMVAMIHAARARSASLVSSHDDIIHSGRAANGLATRVREAVLALIAATDPVDWVQTDLATTLGIDHASLCLEFDMENTRRLPTGAVRKLTRGRDVICRTIPSEATLLHGEAAGLAVVDALVKVSLPGGPGLLALASRDRAMLRRDGAAAALGFLGQALSTAMSKL